MLKINQRSINIIFFSVLTFCLIVLIVLLDIYVFKIYENKYILSREEIEIKQNKVKENLYIKDKSISVKLINSKKISTEIMQIGYATDNLNTENEERYKIISNANKENGWRIKIPKINIDAPIEKGISQNILATAVGHFNETPIWDGNVALAGHNRGIDCNFFQKIKELRIRR